jgi:acyl carrier protein phosphodiesterase
MIGNFIADFVKGKKKDDYPDGIRKGIELHRFIDSYTDHHEVVLDSIRRIHDRQEKYSGVVVDILYDHFLAANFSEFSDVPLQDFSRDTYSRLKENWNVLPEGVHFFLPFMIERNWLLNYATIDGIGRALSGLSVRVKYENRMAEAVKDLQENYAALEGDFRKFFPQLRKEVAERLSL